jgi:hypothetical protein
MRCECDMLIQQGWYFYATPDNFYRVLNVSRQSGVLDIRQAYKRESRQVHPDKNPSTDASEKFQQLTTAYNVRNFRHIIDSGVHGRSYLFCCLGPYG